MKFILKEADECDLSCDTLQNKNRFIDLSELNSTAKLSKLWGPLHSIPYLLCHSLLAVSTKPVRTED